MLLLCNGHRGELLSKVYQFVMDWDEKLCEHKKIVGNLEMDMVNKQFRHLQHF